MRVLRGMLPDVDGLPKVGDTGRTLGARPGRYYEGDIPVRNDGLVQPFTGGMSVSPPPPSNLPRHRRPPVHEGLDSKIEVYELETDALPDELRPRRDPKEPERHVFIEPTRVMSFEKYQRALHATRTLWRPVQ